MDNDGALEIYEVEVRIITEITTENIKNGR